MAVSCHWRRTAPVAVPWALRCVGLAIVAAQTLFAAPSPEVLRVREWRAANERQILGELMRLVALPNLAANRADIAKNADLLTVMFEKRGFRVSRWETPGSPIVFARRDVPNARGSLLFYMHYDGQPTNAKEWTRGAPFKPAAFNGTTPVDLAVDTRPIDPNVRLYGRSASDDKGPIVGLLAAIDGLIATKTTIPWSIRVVLDGEEEVGSPNFDAAMARRSGDVKSDLAIVVDSPRHPSGLPTVFYGSRGGVTATVKVFGAVGDLHSGNYGNFATDPAMALARLLASMKDARGTVRIKGFYDDVVPLTEIERHAIDEIPHVDRKLLDEFALARPEHPESRIEVQHNRPTLSIIGIESGAVYTGTRSAIAAAASARIEMRLVNGLSAATQMDRLIAHIREEGFHVIDSEPDSATRRAHPLIARVMRASGGFLTGKTAMDDPRTAIAVSAIRSLDQPIARLPTIGGSLPFATFSDTLALPTIGLAVVNFDNNQHASNENIRVGNLWEAIDIFAALLTMQR
jgi:acetylornithine deacetylase/succinyl-diaminopimelate desuccinylase-like protein